MQSHHKKALRGIVSGQMQLTWAVIRFQCLLSVQQNKLTWLKYTLLSARKRKKKTVGAAYMACLTGMLGRSDSQGMSIQTNAASQVVRMDQSECQRSYLGARHRKFPRDSSSSQTRTRLPMYSCLDRYSIHRGKRRASSLIHSLYETNLY